MNDKPLTTLNSFDIAQLLTMLPHRYPFLLVDKIIDVNSDESGIGIKNVTINEPHFQGHFPEMPIMPGVLIIEGMAQTAGAMCIAAMRAESGGVQTPKVVYFMTIDQVKFRKPVLPGDRLEYHVKKLKKRGAIWRYAAEGIVDGQKVAEAELTAMIGDR